MDMLHIACLTAAAVLVAATSAGSANLRRRGTDLPLLGHIIGWSLMLGNAASLLPVAPTWYSVVMVALTVAGIAWYLVTVTGTQAAPSRAHRAAEEIYAGRTPTGRPNLRVVQATVVDEPVVSGRRIATQETFAAAGPAGNTATMGSTYVAAHLNDYVDAARTRRAHGRHVARTHSTMDPTQRFLRLAEAYSVDRGPRTLGRSYMA